MFNLFLKSRSALKSDAKIVAKCAARFAATSTALSLVLICGLFPQHAMAQSAAPQAPEVAARAYLLVDLTANQILASKDLDMPVEPASLTKLMSA